MNKHEPMHPSKIKKRKSFLIRQGFKREDIDAMFGDDASGLTPVEWAEIMTTFARLREVPPGYRKKILGIL